MSHQAIIAKIDKIQEIQGANTICAAYVLGTQIVVSKDSKVGDIGILFPSELQLSEKYCHENSLYRHSELNKDINKTGFFEDNRRVRAQPFLKIKSDGYFAPLSSVSYTGYDISKFKIGDSFDKLEDQEVCCKYISKKTRDAISRANRQNKVKTVETPLFLQHIDTEQFRYYVDAIPKGALISISAKQHGCVEAKSKIETKEMGPLTIEEIVKKKLSLNVKAFDIDTKQTIWAEIVGHYYYPDSEDWYLIELEDGSSVTITGNNPVWIERLNCYRRVEDLIVGDELLVTSC